MQGDAESLLHAIEAALDTERALLRAGQLEFLPELAARKDRLIARLGDLPVSGQGVALTRVRDKARANLVLFEAARRGLAAAQARIDVIRSNARALDTYDSKGRRTTVSTGTSQHERRA